MKNHEINILEQLLREWFAAARFDKPDYLNKNKIAKLLKQELIKTKNWKDKPRGSKNNLDNLNKAKQNKETLIKQIEELSKNAPVCICGQKLKKIETGFTCSDFWCEKSNFTLEK